MKENEFYFNAGIYNPAPDGPALCTPLFRNEEGDRYFVQSPGRGGRIREFEYVGHVPDPIVKIPLLNKPLRSGSPMHYALDCGGGIVYIEEKERICDRFRENTEYFRGFPFLFYHLAIFCKDENLVVQALDMPEIRIAIERKFIPFVFPRNKRQKVSKITVYARRYLLNLGYKENEVHRMLALTPGEVNVLDRRDRRRV